MWRRPVVTISLLITALILTLPVQARQRMVTPGISPAQADVAAGFSPAPRLSRSRQPAQLRFPNMYGAALKDAATTPATSPAQADVAPGFSPAHADVAASLPRHGGVKPPLRYAALMDGGAVAAVSDRRTAVGTRQKAERRSALQSAALKDGATTATSAKPFTQEQVVSMVRDGLGDESGAKLIEQRGIGFALSEDFIQTLEAADRLCVRRRRHASTGNRPSPNAGLDNVASSSYIEVMKSVGLRELKNRLSEYVREVRSGEGVLVTDRGEVVAELIPPGQGRDAEGVPGGLAALARRGQITLGAPNNSAVYPKLPRLLKPHRATELLHEERGAR